MVVARAAPAPPRTPSVCLGLWPRAPLERFVIIIVVIIDGGSGGAPVPLHPPRLLGLRPRAPLERFAFRSLSEPSSVCGTPKNEIPIYISHAATQKERVQREIPICILWIKGAQIPGRPRHTIPGLRPHTPPVKNIPGGPPPPSNYHYWCYYSHYLREFAWHTYVILV